MSLKHLTLAGLFVALLPAVSQARDTTHFLPFQAAVDEATPAGRLDGSVRFYLAGQPVRVAQRMGEDVTNKKTNAANKSDEQACR